MRRQAKSLEKGLLINAFLISIISLMVSCSGGGGGDDSSSNNASGLRRTTKTGIKIIHGALDETPITIVMNDVVVQTTRYSESAAYAEVSQGDQLVTLIRANTPSVVLGTFPVSFKKNFEYTIFVYEGRTGDTSFKIIEDEVVQPEKGMARVRLANAYSGASSVTVQSAVATLTAGQGGFSDFVDIATPGPVLFEVFNASGEKINSKLVDIQDRSEVTLLVAGAADDGFSSVQSIVDLD